MTLRHWQMEKVSGSAEPLLSTTGNKGLYKSAGSTIVHDSTALFGKSSVRSKHFFDTDAAGSLSDNEFTIGFWFYVPTGTELRYIFQLGLHNTDVSANGHTCVGLFYSYYSNKIFFTTGYRTAAQGSVELGGLSQNVWHHCYISRTNSGTNSTLQVKITRTDGTVVHDESEVYTKADFSIDESGTGQYSYFNGHPAGGSLTLTNGRIEDFILKNGSVLSYASIYNSSAEVFQSDEPQVSVSTGAGSATLSDSNFTGTKTYSFYDTDATTLLQSGTSNSYNSYASSSVAYTALVTDTNNNRVISTFYISQGGNGMASSSDRKYILNAEMLGGLELGASGEYDSLRGGASGSADAVLSGTINNANIVAALNSIYAEASGNAPGAPVGSLQYNAGGGAFGGSEYYNIAAVGSSATVSLSGSLIASGSGTTIGLNDGANSVALGSDGSMSASSTLQVGGEATLASAIVSDLTDNQVVLAGTNGALEGSGDFTFDGSSLSIGGAATLDVASGLASLDGGINVDDAFTVSALGAVTTTSTISGSGIIQSAASFRLQGTNESGNPRIYDLDVVGGVLVVTDVEAP